MKTVSHIVLIIALVLSVPAFAKAPPVGSAAGGGPMPSLAPMVKHVSPAVVNISTYARVQYQSPLMNNPFFRRFFNLQQQHHSNKPRAVAAGSGVIVNAKKGYILTNAHVIEHADIIKVTLKDGRTYKAKLVGKDKPVDIAVLQIKADNLTQIQLAHSSSLQVGDYVVAIGNPFALGQTVTSGIVSALGRTGLGIEGYENFIQTDASINPGNSGGALVNLKGQLVGIPTAIIAPSGGNVGIGFAIPVSMAVSVMHQLIENGKVERGMLGVTIQSLTPELAQAFNVDENTRGVVITRVLDDSAADKAGLKAGDVVIAMNGDEITDAAQLRTKVSLTPVGDEVTLTILRNGDKQKIDATIQKRTLAGNGGSISNYLDGARLKTLHPGELSYANQGVLVKDVEAGSQAARAGIRSGDVIVNANHEEIDNISDLKDAISKDDNGVLLRINRRGNIFFLVIR